jgi:hypothetical protein
LPSNQLQERARLVPPASVFCGECTDSPKIIRLDVDATSGVLRLPLAVTEAGFFHKHDGNAVSYRVPSAAALADQLVTVLGYGGPASGAGQDIE